MAALPRIEGDWLRATALALVLRALGGRAWCVGGAVRDALQGRPVSDVDLATPMEPAAVQAALVAAGLRAVPTGLAHGTITAVTMGRSFEITTFRADVATDGRHAQVRFGLDMVGDARRRDFTMNALYCDGAGQVIDPLRGIGDLRAGHVRFIGDPRARIAEDYLRILRFFRFAAWVGRGPLDAAGLAAVTELAPGLDQLSRERVGVEFRKLLAAPDPGPVLAAMAGAGVLARCLPGADAGGVPALVARERALGLAPDWRLRLAALGGQGVTDALRLSRVEALEQAHLRALMGQPLPPAQAAHQRGAWAARGAALLTGASDWRLVEAEVARGAAARFPLGAADLLPQGFAPGPALGAALAQAQAAWVASDFALDRDALLAQVAPKDG